MCISEAMPSRKKAWGGGGGRSAPESRGDLPRRVLMPLCMHPEALHCLRKGGMGAKVL